VEGTWIKLIRHWTRAPSMQSLTSDEFRLWHQGLDYSASNALDGLIPLGDIATVARPIYRWRPSAHALVEQGRWHDQDGWALCESEFCRMAPTPGSDHYLIHDFLEHQPSRTKVAADRRAARERMKQRRHGPPPDQGILPHLASPAAVGIVDLGALEEVLDPNDQAHLMRQAAKVNERFATAIKPTHIEIWRANHGDEALTEALRVLMASPETLPGIKQPAAYVGKILDRLGKESA
jgi:hypothetical protein